MKTPIEVSEIRAGDKILATYKVFDAEYEVTYISSADRSPWKSKREVDMGSEVKHFLLDRPKPPVDLPTEPSLGWADGQLGFWNEWKGTLNGRFANGHVSQAPRPDNYVAATAVPTSVLKALKDAWPWDAPTPVAKFLAAVDDTEATS